MEEATNDFDGQAEQLNCEECRADNAQPVRVEFRDEKVRTINLCESCVTDFRTAEFVEDVAAINRDTSTSTD